MLSRKRRFLAEQIQNRLPRTQRPRHPIAGQARFVGHTERMVNRRAEVLRANGLVLDVGADLVGLAVDHAAANAAAGKDGRIAIRPVESARRTLRVDFGGTSELANDHQVQADFYAASRKLEGWQ